jgi:formylglycine-generating enzyme required for sulfatase activity
MEPFVEPRSGLEFVYVPGGEFRMGSADEEPDAQPVHRVKLAPFWISRCEVARFQYARFMESTGRQPPSHWKDKRFSSDDAQPVVGVTWEDAAEFCRWAGGRLPTEAEWEYAARGSTGSRRFPWGDALPDATRAHCHQDIGFGGTQAVGLAKAGASPFGVLDLAGNVFEWCADWYSADYYARSPQENPTGPASGTLRVIRGGAWISLPDACHAAARGKSRPESRSLLVGIRVVRAGPP